MSTDVASQGLALASGDHAEKTFGRTLGLRGIACLTAAASVWTFGVALYGIWRHHQFLSHRYDLGNMVQAVWSSANGRLLEATDGATGEQITRLASHVDPILLLAVPAWWMAPRPEALIVLQTAALAAGLYPVVRLALKYTGSMLAAALLGAWYLVSPWILWAAVNDVHGVTLAVPALLYAIWYLDEHRLLPFSVAAVLALACGELIGLTVGALGVWYAIRYRRARVGLAISAAGAGWTALCLGVLIPSLNDGEQSPFYGRFETVGGSPSGVLETVLSNPDTIVDAMTSPADLRYLALALLPTALLALGSLGMTAVAAPQLAVNLMSDFWSTTQPMFQYTAPTIPPLIAASIMSLRRFSVRSRVWVAAAPLVGALLCLFAFPPVPGGQDFLFGRLESRGRIEAMRAGLERVPDGVPVIATNRLGAHLSARRRVFLFPMQGEAKWAVLDMRDAWLQVAGERVNNQRFTALVRSFERDGTWSTVYAREDIHVYVERG